MRNLKIGSVSELVQRLRRCGTRGDAGLKPYALAAIRLERIQIAELVPLAKYVLEDQLQIVAALHRELTTVGVDIFDLASGCVWPNGQDERPIVCPIVEYWDREGLLLVDGLHRVWAARENGRTELMCAVISDVAAPLVPLPVTWEEVRVYGSGQRPAERYKRAYRFSDAASLRSAFPLIADKVTDENFRYFLYRDLDELGSSGIRTPSLQLCDRSGGPEEEDDERP